MTGMEFRCRGVSVGYCGRSGSECVCVGEDTGKVRYCGRWGGNQRQKLRGRDGPSLGVCKVKTTRKRRCVKRGVY